MHEQLVDNSGPGVFCCHPSMRLMTIIANSPLYMILCILAIFAILTLTHKIFYKHKPQYLNWFIVSLVIFSINSIMYIDLIMPIMPISSSYVDAEELQNNFIE